MDTIEKIEAFKRRTKAMALRIIKMYQQLPKTGEAQVIGKQVLRSGTSVAANYRAVARNKSEADKYINWEQLWKKLMKPCSGWN